MAEYLERKSLIWFVKHYTPHFNGETTMRCVTRSIRKAPAVEIVYCKDCKYNVANSKHDPLDITDYTDITCEYFMTDGMSPNDFCSQGVKIPVINMEDVPKIMEEKE